jgi:hypothetical protein
MNNLLLTIITTLISVLVGGLITWRVSYTYYKKSADELKIEANKLRKHNTLMLHALENAGLAEFTKDSEGDYTALVIKLSGAVKSSSKVTGELTVENKSGQSNREN